MRAAAVAFEAAFNGKAMRPARSLTPTVVPWSALAFSLRRASQAGGNLGQQARRSHRTSSIQKVAGAASPGEIQVHLRLPHDIPH